ncbi:PIN domain-containing protein [Streptomyces atratus]|uniref:PIN domain-containing protein n=1 Tax=Streptomyces atratus TaxID=1893 RepID=UPI002252BFFA|nr:PIN domain-containing protein [Streptomyces atratus]MCX5342600.1 VapC toxin family PIN domain ribonuclease [Streptomyces atratus]
MSEQYLLDKSAFARWKQPVVAKVLDPPRDRGLLCMSAAVRVEAMYSARGATDAKRLDRWMSGFDHLPCPDEVWDTVLDTQRVAVLKGNHRAFSLADLLIASTAQRHGVTVLHGQEYGEYAERLTHGGASEGRTVRFRSTLEVGGT